MRSRCCRQRLFATRSKIPPLFKRRSVVSLISLSIECNKRPLQPCSPAFLPRGNRALRWHGFSERFAFHTNSLPKFQIQQAPDPVSVVPTRSAVFGEQPLDDIAFEISALARARFQEQPLEIIELRTREPKRPWRREPHFLTIHNIAGQDVLDGGFQNELARKSLCVVLRGNTGCELHQFVIE